MDFAPIVDDLVGSVMSAVVYARSAARVARRGRRLGSENRLVFVVGSPRSGTTFTAGALGALPGFVDLGEVEPWFAAIPLLFGLADHEAAWRLRRILERVRSLALARGLRGVEQSPDTSFVLAAALRAYPNSVAVHVIRDGRDVVTSLLAKGWLSPEHPATDRRQRPWGAYARFWVEPGRRAEFESASNATRAAWAWRRFVTAACTVPSRTVELRYEQLVADPYAAAAPVAARLGVDTNLLAREFAKAHDRAAGRWRRELGPAELDDVHREAGDLLSRLGYC
jgi:hypothetical protein